jgi:hypothetical protein
MEMEARRDADLDAFLVRHTPWPPHELPAVLPDLRREFAHVLDDLTAIPGDTLERAWRWRADVAEAEGLEVELRYAFYRAYEALDEAAGRIRRGRAGPAGGAGLSLLSDAFAARWDLRGALAGATDRTLDRDPGGGEWTVRQTLAHIVGGQRAFTWFSAWWADRRDASDFPARVPDDAVPGFPDEEDEAPGGLEAIFARLDHVIDLGLRRFGSAPPDVLDARARWSGYPVTVAFRLGRTGSHIREHTVQVDKTLEMLSRDDDDARERDHSEIPRLVRVVCGAYGRLEAAVIEASSKAGTHGDGESPEAIARAAVVSLASDVRDARQAASG